MSEFLRVVLGYSSKASAASSHSFLRHSQGCLPGPVGNRRKGTSSWSPQLPPPTQGVLPHNGRSSPTPSLTHTARSKMNKHFSLFSAAAAREQLKEPISCKARAHWGSSRHASPPETRLPASASWVSAGPWEMGPSGKERAGSAIKQGCRPTQRAAPAIGRAGQ